MDRLILKYLQSVCTAGEFEEFKIKFLQGKIDKDVSRLLHEHFHASIQNESDIPVNRELWDRISKAIDEVESKASIRKLKLYSWSLRAAAVLVIGLFISTFFFYQRYTSESQIVVNQRIMVPNGARSSLTLPDGSLVWLNSGSSLKYSGNFSKNRVVELEGEAYFNVEKSDVPFEVHVPYGKVTVTGTAFNVKAFSAGIEFETTVEEGTVIVSSPSCKSAASLKAGQQAKLGSAGWELTRVDTELYTSWKDGKIIFRNEYLPSVAKRLERWYNVKIQLDDDPRLNKINYTGTLEMESFSEVMELLCVTASINYTYNDKTRVIRITHR